MSIQEKIRQELLDKLNTLVVHITKQEIPLYLNYDSKGFTFRIEDGKHEYITLRTDDVFKNESETIKEFEQLYNELIEHKENF